MTVQIITILSPSAFGPKFVYYLGTKPYDMKTLLKGFVGIFTLVSLSGCANGKKLQEKAPVAFQEVYYTIHLAQGDSNAARLNLFIPTDTAEKAEVSLDSVYFRGRSAALISEGQPEGVFVGYFDLPEKNRDMVMHVDPKEEFGNSVPVLEKIPFDLKSDEAVVVYSKNGESGYYKLSGIKEKGSAQER